MGNDIKLARKALAMAVATSGTNARTAAEVVAQCQPQQQQGQTAAPQAPAGMR